MALFVLLTLVIFSAAAGPIVERASATDAFAATPDSSHEPARSITFNRDIAPIIHKNCTVCHQEGQSAPFSLVTYDDVAKRAVQIADTTRDRYMPPWLPEDGFGNFLERRRLTNDEIGLIQRWVAQGAVEGTSSNYHEPALLRSGWTLGHPDLVVTMSQAYTLPADGRDVYRNFVVPLGLKEGRYVKAIEFRPNSKTIHHAFIRVDRTRQSQRLDANDPEPGFGGMASPPSG